MPLETIQLGRPNSAGGEDEAKGQSGFSATPEEMQAIAERMKDPTFVKLMHEYMQSLEDPETLREEEAYLRQVEKEAKEGGDYSVEFIFPRAAFVIELLQPSTRRLTEKELRDKGVTDAAEVKRRRGVDVSCYVNFCTSDKVDEFREETTGNAMGSNWHVPVSVSRKRVEYYEPTYTSQQPKSNSTNGGSSGNSSTSHEMPALCFVYDAVYHPKTLALAERSTRFMCFLVEIAVEQINAGYGESNGFEFRRLPSSVQAIGRPQNQTIRRKQKGKEGQSSPFAIQPNAPVLTRPTKHLPSLHEEEDGEEDKKKKEEERKTAQQASTHTQKKEKDTKPAAATPLPPHTIVHRGRIELSDAWNWRVREQRVGVPEELVVTLDFSACTRVTAAAAIDIELSEDGSALVLHRTREQDLYDGMLVLPFSVHDPPVKAQFDRSRRRLTLVLKVQPPPLLAGQRSAQDVRVELGLQPAQSEEKKANVQDEEDGRKEECERGNEAEAQTHATTAEQTSNTHDEPADNATATAVSKNDVRAHNDDNDEAKKKEEEKEEEDDDDSAPPPKLRPMLEYMQDSERVRMMLEKVEEARRAREAAEAEAAKQTAAKEGKPEAAPAEEVPHEEEEVKEEEVKENTTKDTAAAAKEEEEVDNTATQPVELIDLTSKTKKAHDDQDAAEAPAADTAVRAAQNEAEIALELAQLRAQQDAWVAKMRAEMAQAQAEQRPEEGKEADEVHTVQDNNTATAEQDENAERAKAAAESRAQQRKLQAMREAERLEAEAQAKMNALPLSNKYIFAID